jgi:heme exporter protein A
LISTPGSNVHSGQDRPATALELRRLGCSRGSRRLFSAIDLTLVGGELLRVLGANGAGKTSLLRILCGLTAPNEGEVIWQGRSLSAQRDDFHRDLIYLGHAAALKDDLTALENLIAASVMSGHRLERALALQALADAGLRTREHLPARSLSQGQRRRVNLARLVHGRSARLWVLDEPFNALDTAASEWLAALVAAHLTQGGVVVLTSHQPVALDASVRQRELIL